MPAALLFQQCEQRRIRLYGCSLLCGGLRVVLRQRLCAEYRREHHLLCIRTAFQIELPPERFAGGIAHECHIQPVLVAVDAFGQRVGLAAEGGLLRCIVREIAAGRSRIRQTDDQIFPCSGQRDIEQTQFLTDGFPAVLCVDQHPRQRAPDAVRFRVMQPEPDAVVRMILVRLARVFRGKGMPRIR